MKKLFFIITILSTLLVSCDVASNITDYDKSKLNITLYADDTELKGGFEFTASEAWSTFVEYQGESENWITIDPASGNAGNVTLNITIEENHTGDTRTAIVHIICGESNLNITISQKETTNPDDDNENTGGEEPATKLEHTFIERIIQTIDDNGETVVYTYTFGRDDYSHLTPITLVRIDGLPREDGAATVYDGRLEFHLSYNRNDVYIETYANDNLYETLHATTQGRYIEQLSYSETIEMIPSAGSEMDMMQGVETHTYYFNRHSSNDQIYRTDYVCETTFDGHEEYNNCESTSYNFEWERVDEEYYGGIDYFNHAYNLTQLSWIRDEWEENYEYMQYNPNLNISNILGKSGPIEEKGCYIDINHLITTFWHEGSYKAYGECYGILGLLGLITPPSYNLISDLSYRYGEWQGSNSHVEYTLNENEQIDSFTMSNSNSSAHVKIEYTKH